MVGSEASVTLLGHRTLFILKQKSTHQPRTNEIPFFAIFTWKVMAELNPRHQPFVRSGWRNIQPQVFDELKEEIMFRCTYSYLAQREIYIYMVFPKLFSSVKTKECYNPYNCRGTTGRRDYQETEFSVASYLE